MAAPRCDPAGAGLSPFNTEALLFGSLTATVVMSLVIIDDLAEPDDGLYSVNDAREVLRAGLRAQAQSMLLDHEPAAHWVNGEMATSSSAVAVGAANSSN